MVLSLIGPATSVSYKYWYLFVCKATSTLSMPPRKKRTRATPKKKKNEIEDNDVILEDRYRSLTVSFILTTLNEAALY
jgi:hypothetical protein